MCGKNRKVKADNKNYISKPKSKLKCIKTSIKLKKNKSKYSKSKFLKSRLTRKSLSFIRKINFKLKRPSEYYSKNNNKEVYIKMRYRQAKLMDISGQNVNKFDEKAYQMLLKRKAEKWNVIIDDFFTPKKMKQFGLTSSQVLKPTTLLTVTNDSVPPILLSYQSLVKVQEIKTLD